MLVIAAAAALAVALLDWNLLRGPIAHKLGSLTGRSVAINGDLKVSLFSLRPRVTADDVVLGNAAWVREPVMAEIKRIDVTVDLLKLLAGKVEFPQIALSQPRMAFEVNRDGEPNWVLDARSASAPAGFPVIGSFIIDRGTATFRDPRNNTDLAFELKTIDAASAPPFGLELTGHGRYKGLPAAVNARGGALLGLRSADDPYPIKASGSVGTTRFGIDGKLFDPIHFAGEQLNFTIEGSDLALLFPIVGIPMPQTPPYRFAGFLDHADHLWSFRRFKGTMGSSDLAGDFSVDHSAHPQKLVADLVSRNLALKDLAGFVGAHGDPAAGSAASGKVLPSEPFNLDKLAAADVDAHLRADRIVTANLPLDKLNAHLLVNGGVVKLEPLDFGVAGGNVVLLMEMDAKRPRMATHARITARGLNLARMFPGSKLGGGDTGTLGGRATLKGNGNSIGQMLASASGDAALVMEGGTVGELALRMSNLDLAHSVTLLLGGDRQVPVRCMVGIFNAVEGDFKVKALVLDTAKVNMTGSGNIDFTDESLHLRLVSQSKGFSLVSLRGPIAVTGSFKTPVLRPELQKAVLRGGLAVALGVATAGIGTLVPLIDFGRKSDSDCAALMSQAQSEAGVKAGDIAPRVGK